MARALQVTSLSVSAAFTVTSGQVATLSWMFREDAYYVVRHQPISCTLCSSCKQVAGVRGWILGTLVMLCPEHIALMRFALVIT